MSDWGDEEGTWSEEENNEKKIESQVFPKEDFYGFVAKGDLVAARKLFICERENLHEIDTTEFIQFIQNQNWPKITADGSTQPESLKTLFLLELGSKNMSQHEIQRALFEFAMNGNRDYLSALLDLQIDPNLTDAIGQSAVHFANHVEIVKVLRLAGVGLKIIF